MYNATAFPSTLYVNATNLNKNWSLFFTYPGNLYYTPSTGETMVNLFNFQSFCINEGDIIQLSADDGAKYTGYANATMTSDIVSWADDNITLTTGLVCGNNIHQNGEECDGTDDAACPGVCQADCTCPDVLYGVLASWGLSTTQTLTPGTAWNYTITLTKTGVYNQTLNITPATLTLGIGNVTITFNQTSGIPLTGTTRLRAQAYVDPNATVTTTPFTGQVNVTNSSGSVLASLTASVKTQQITVRARRWFILTAEGIVRPEFCIGEPVLVTANDSRTEEPVKDVNIDVIFNGVEIFIDLMTNKSGQVTFTPTEAGEHTILAEKARYHDGELTITISDCGLITTTTTPIASIIPKRYFSVDITCSDKEIFLYAKERDSGYSVKDASVDIIYDGEKILYNLRTDANGVVSFTPHGSGEYHTTVEKSRYYDWSGSVKFPECISTNLTTTTITTTTLEPTSTSTTVKIAPTPSIGTTTTITTTTQCNGCISGNTCISFGTRIGSKFCGTNGKMLQQKLANEPCQNNYECASNLCANGQCGDIRKEVQERRSLLDRIIDFLKSILPFL